MALPPETRAKLNGSTEGNTVRGPRGLTGGAAFWSNFRSGEVDFQTTYGYLANSAAHLITALRGFTHRPRSTASLMSIMPDAQWSFKRCMVAPQAALRT